MYFRIEPTSNSLQFKEIRVRAQHGYGSTRVLVTAEVFGTTPLEGVDFVLQLTGSALLEVEGRRRFLAPLSPPVLLPLGLRHGKELHAHVQLELPLTDGMLDAVERERRGRAVELQFELEGLLTADTGQWWRVRGQDSYRLSAGEWADLLADAKHYSIIRFEISTMPPSPSDRAEEWSRAIGRLEQAQRSMWTGDYQQVVAHIRHVVELLWPHVTRRQLAGTSADDTMSDRFDVLVGGLRHLTQLSHHEDSPARQAVWTRADAVAAVAIAGALMQRVSEHRPFSS